MAKHNNTVSRFKDTISQYRMLNAIPFETVVWYMNAPSNSCICKQWLETNIEMLYALDASYRLWTIFIWKIFHFKWNFSLFPLSFVCYNVQSKVCLFVSSVSFIVSVACFFFACRGERSRSKWLHDLWFQNKCELKAMQKFWTD